MKRRIITAALLIAVLVTLASCAPGGGGGDLKGKEQVELYERKLKSGKPMFVLYTSPT